MMATEEEYKVLRDYRQDGLTWPGGSETAFQRKDELGFPW